MYVTTPDGAVVAELYGYLGRASNNVAEYQALIHALKYALDHGATAVKVFSDSELVVRQISGQYRVKHPDMVPLHGKARGVPSGDWSGKLYRDLSHAASRQIDITLVPYFAWDNRGTSEMTVWLPLAR